MDAVTALFERIKEELPPLPCSVCGEPRDRANQRYCRSCHAAYMRRWRSQDARFLCRNCHLAIHPHGNEE